MGELMMKKLLFFMCINFIGICYGEVVNMNKKLANVIPYYFEKLIPRYYRGREDFSREMYLMHMNYDVGMQGNGFSIMEDTEDLIFDFYYLINQDRQNVQGILLTRIEKENKIYEYWIFALSDRGTPYRYAYFYLTETQSLTAKRKIIDISKKYKERYVIDDAETLDLTVKNLITLYQLGPWKKLESFTGTKYENIVVKWKNGVPYQRTMNIFEMIYYKWLQKTTARE